MSYVQEPDPEARILTLVIVAALLIVGAFAIFVLDASGPALQRRMAESVRTAAVFKGSFIALAGIASLSVLGMAAYVRHVAARTIETGRFPPAGARVVGRTVVLHGEAALARGRMLRALGNTLVVLALALPVLAWLAAESLVPARW